ncbi:Outer membrane protein TolC [Gallionellaceae bacterium]|nr:Outer membrane protein TolC [Gallionellaceae bacterium]
MGRTQVALFGGLMLLSSAVFGAGLMEAYQAARQHDPTFRAARFERAAGEQSTVIARAALLPNISISANRFTNHGERSLTSGAANQPLDYRSSQDAISLRQPLINFEGVAKYKQGGLQDAYSAAVFNQKEADLVVQVAAAYFDVLLATDQLALSDAEVAAFEDQYKLAQRRHSGGEGTVTEIAETESRLKIAEASRVDTKDQLSVAVQVLEDMTGNPAGPLHFLHKNFIPTAVQPDNLEAWLAMAQNKSPVILAQRKVLESATLEVDRVWAGHLPRLDVVASISNNENDTVNTLNQKIYSRSLGLQLNVPLYAGGGVVAATEREVANMERTSAELDAIVSKVLVEVKRQFLAAQTGIIKVAAYEKAVDASLVAVEGMKKGMAAGIRTNTDVLDAQRQLYSTKRDLGQARYTLLASQLKLKAAAGILSEQDVEKIDQLLALKEGS